MPTDADRRALEARVKDLLRDMGIDAKDCSSVINEFGELYSNLTTAADLGHFLRKFDDYAMEFDNPAVVFADYEETSPSEAQHARRVRQKEFQARPRGQEQQRLVRHRGS